MRRWSTIAALAGAVLFQPSLAHATPRYWIAEAANTTKHEQYSVAFRTVEAAFLNWLALNPTASEVPVGVDLGGYHFQVTGIPGLEIQPSLQGGNATICVKASATNVKEVGMLAKAAQDLQAVLSEQDCSTAAGDSVLGGGFPKTLALRKTFVRSKVLQAAVLPTQPLVNPGSAGFIEVGASAPASVLVRNTTGVPLTMTSGSITDPSFALTSDCQTPVANGQTCSVSVSVSGSAPTSKRVGRVNLQFSNGAQAEFSFRYQP